MQKVRLDKSNAGSQPPSEVVSHYLEAIFYMWSEGEPLRSARLADWLGVSRPTVTGAVRGMTGYGMGRMNRRKESELTAKGRPMAEASAPGHRITDPGHTDG